MWMDGFIISNCDCEFCSCYVQAESSKQSWMLQVVCVFCVLFSYNSTSCCGRVFLLFSSELVTSSDFYITRPVDRCSAVMFTLPDWSTDVQLIALVQSSFHYWTTDQWLVLIHRARQANWQKAVHNLTIYYGVRAYCQLSFNSFDNPSLSVITIPLIQLLIHDDWSCDIDSWFQTKIVRALAPVVVIY